MAFIDFDFKIRKLVLQKKFKESITLLESGISNYPDNLYEITYWLLKLYTLEKEYKKSISILEYGLENNLWYDLNPNFLKFLSPLNKYENFIKLIKMNQEKKEGKLEKSKCLYKLLKPERCKQHKKYPLLIVLHGYGQNIEIVEEHWFLEKFKSKTYIAFIQSSQLVVPNGYGWNNTEMGFEEITYKFDEIVDNYSIDKENVIIAGFSQGGNMAINITINSKILNRGFIALCPGNGMPDNFKENVKKIDVTKSKGVIITGDQDNNLSSQKEMSRILRKNNFKHNFIINPEMSHWHPVNFYKQLEDAISYLILDKK